ncbi:MAG: hypothetical protein Q9201_004451 [Fulgogasparrea decipioides]
MPAPYEIRAGGDVKNKKQSMADLKLRRLNELNSRLREDLERPRIRVSEASMSLHLPPQQPRPVVLGSCLEAILTRSPLPQINTVLPEHQRLYGTVYMGTGESFVTPSPPMRARPLPW